MRFGSLSSIGAGELSFDASADISSAISGGMVRQQQARRIRQPEPSRAEAERRGRYGLAVGRGRYDPDFDRMAEEIERNNSAGSEFEDQIGG